MMMKRPNYIIFLSQWGTQKFAKAELSLKYIPQKTENAAKNPRNNFFSLFSMNLSN